jgi:uncharacterized membrane protein
MRLGCPNGIMQEGDRFVEGASLVRPRLCPCYDGDFPFETDPRLHRLLALADGVFAIALTLLAVQFTLPEVTEDLRGDALLPALLGSWPKVLSYATSFTIIAIFWQAHHRLFLEVRRFDGILLWLVFLQLGCIAFVPFPTAVVGERVTNPVAQEFYYGTLLVNGLVWVLLRWYATAGHRLVGEELSSRDLRPYLRLSLAAPVVFLVVMALIPLGVGRLINPLLLGYLLALCYIALAAADTWEQRRERLEAAEGARGEGAAAKGQRANDEDVKS